MDDIHKIKECLRELAGFAPIETEVAKVLSVDGAACKVSRVRDGMVIDKVRLNAITTSDKGVVVVPKTGTYVLVTRIGENGWFVSQCGEAERITIDAGTKIVINGGGYGGLIKIEDLVNELNRLVEVFNSHTHTVVEAVAKSSELQMQRLNRNDIENTYIEHGDPR
jgi:hypothetical protein